MDTQPDAATTEEPKKPTESGGFEVPWLDRLMLAFSCAMMVVIGRVEKYRPSNLDDIVGNEETVNRLKVCFCCVLVGSLALIMANFRSFQRTATCPTSSLLYADCRNRSTHYQTLVL
jgi:hypothetical protein